MIRRKRDENDEKLFFFSLRELFSQILSRILAKIVYILRMEKERFYHRFLKKKKKFYQSFIKKKKKKPSRRGNFLRNLEGEEIGWKSWRARLSLYIEGLLFSVLVGILFNSKAKTRLPTWIPFATSPDITLWGGREKKKREKNQCCDSRRVSWRNSLSRRAALFSLSSLQKKNDEIKRGRLNEVKSKTERFVRGRIFAR